MWDRYGQFAGHPWIRGTVTWTLADRCIVIAGDRGGRAFEGAARVSPRPGCRARVDRDLCVGYASVPGSRQSVWRDGRESVRSIARRRRAAGPSCRGPPVRRRPQRRERPGGQPGLPLHRRLSAPNKDHNGQCSRLADGRARPAFDAARVRWRSSRAPPWWGWRWLSASSISTRRAWRLGATICARAGLGRRPSVAAGSIGGGLCRCAAAGAGSCPWIWRRGWMRWPAISRSGFSRGRSCPRGWVACRRAC